jgi:hypothetical protein
MSKTELEVRNDLAPNWTGNEGPAARLSESPPGQQRYDLTRFTLADMVRCGRALRSLVAESASMEEAAQKATRCFYEHCRDQISNDRFCVLVRFFKTHPYGGLHQELRAFADSKAGGAALGADTKCLTLLATSGDDPKWNSRRTSTGHQCIPLLSAAMVGQFPMISQLIHQLGLTTTELVRPTAEIIQDLGQKQFGVFHIPVAANSPFIPAQEEFVAPYGIASVLGFGGMLPGGDLFAAILFARVAIPASTAEMFRTIALDLKLGLLALLEKPVFAG